MRKDNHTITWSHHPDDWELQPNQVDIWRILLDLSRDPVKSVESMLSADETQRSTRFHFAQDRNQFVLSHGYLRAILARTLHCRTDQLEFSPNEYGKPTLAGNNLEFNLSHSGVFALIAVSRLHKVGIDVEQIRQDVEIETLARRFFSQMENSDLMEIPHEERIAAFYRCWTLKEAYIKAHGLGLSLPLNGFDVSFSRNEQVILKATRPNPAEASRWRLLSLEVDPEYAGAVAVENNNPEFRYWDGNSLAVV